AQGCAQTRGRGGRRGPGARGRPPAAAAARAGPLTAKRPARLARATGIGVGYDSAAVMGVVEGMRGDGGARSGATERVARGGAGWGGGGGAAAAAPHALERLGYATAEADRALRQVLAADGGGRGARGGDTETLVRRALQLLTNG